MKLFNTLFRTRSCYNNVHTLLDEAPVLISIWMDLILFICVIYLFIYLFIFVIFPSKL